MCLSEHYSVFDYGPTSPPVAPNTCPVAKLASLDASKHVKRRDLRRLSRAAKRRIGAKFGEVIGKLSVFKTPTDSPRPNRFSFTP